MKYLFSIFLFTCLQSCAQSGGEPSYLVLDENLQPLRTIAFGSCSKQNQPQSMWAYISENEPDLWIWLGDIIYGDSKDPTVLQRKYQLLKENPGYKTFIKKTPVIGVWDDHDYGVNDGDKTFEIKTESKKLLLDFLEIDESADIRNREGVYMSYEIGPIGKKVKIILLDARYFRDELVQNPEIGGQRYLPNEDGDILGEDQWNWLENELITSDAQVHIIGSGVQVIPEEHYFEKWANFPKARQRLFDILVKTQPENAIIISGDRHLAEISKIDLNGLSYPLYDITSSGLTHSYTAVNTNGEPNHYRVDGKISGEKNFGLFKINWEKAPLSIDVEIRGEGNKLLLNHSIEFKK